jgi:hypothetical protein
LGPIATIAFVAFDPFFQSVINYSGEAIASTAPFPYTRRTESFTKGICNLDQYTWDYRFTSPKTLETNYSLTLSDYKAQPDLGWIAATLDGFTNVVSVRKDAFAYCQTGNCTWPTYRSLAVCSSCVDISSSIVEEECDIETTTDPSVVGTRYRLPTVSMAYGKSWRFSDSVGSRKFSDGTVGAWFPPTLAVNATAYPVDTVAFQHLKSPIITAIRMDAGDAFITKNAPWDQASPKATECALYWCIKSYNTSVVKGQTVETASDVEFETNIIAQGKSPEDTEAINAFFNSTKSIWRREGIPEALDTATAELELRPLSNQEEKFSVGYNSSVGAVQYLLDWMVGQRIYNITLLSTGNDLELAQWNQQLTYSSKYPFFNYDDQSQVAAPVLIYLESTNLSEATENAARSMSIYMRDYTGISVDGTANSWITQIQVNWTYLVIPILTFATGCIYVLLVIKETHGLNLPIWKEDALPMLAYGVDSELRGDLRRDFSSRTKGTEETLVQLHPKMLTLGIKPSDGPFEKR